MSELGPIPPALQALYAEEHAAPCGGFEERTRIRTRVLASLGIAIGIDGVASSASAAGTTAGSAGTAATTAGATAGAAGAVSIAGKIIVLAVATGVVSGGMYWRASSAPRESERIATVPHAAAPDPDREVPPIPSAVPPALVSIDPAPSPQAPFAPVAIVSSQPRRSLPRAPIPVPPQRSQVARAAAAPTPPLATLPLSPPLPVPVTEASPVPPASEEPALVPAPENSLPLSPKGGGAAAPQQVVLARAWVAIERGEPETALELVERHSTALPESMFSEEREALRVVALRRLRRHTEARAAARAFETRYPDSIHWPLVNPALAEAP